ncbi:hypothetical protein O3M35_007151 [Rhynocoris fuscipes]|uniref:RNA helicase n=1 Tax=Rhynocoris fuscipes TaxID=488301 RepID=A0AAW1D9P2_9HEMI
MLTTFRNFRTLRSVTRTFATEAELLELFEPKEKPHYDRIIIPEPKAKEETVQNVNALKKKEPVLIKCKRSEFNHYKNQKYDKLKAIPLASKGWYHRKSVGDFFSIKIYDENYDRESLYWEGETTFTDLKLESSVIDALKTQGIINPTKIQVDSIPKLLSGRNCLIAAETGCGKTYAFLLPIIEQLLVWNKMNPDRPPNHPLAVILCPQRELAFQIGSLAKNMSYCLPFTCNTLIGGRTKKKMLNPEFSYVDLLVATPGALSKLISTGIYHLNEVKHIVVDEADTMLDDSFSELLIRILSKVKINYKNPPLSSNVYPDGAQLTLVSATMPKAVYETLEGILETDSLTIVKSKRLHRLLPHVTQTFYRLSVPKKPTKLLQLAKQSLKNRLPTLVFSNKSSTCDWISIMLNDNDVPTVNLNGEMNHAIRLGKFNEFKHGNAMILSCTDVASRGLDTTNVKHILNYDFPIYMADYIHRCGRTGRCGSPSETLVTNFITRHTEVDLLQKIELAVRLQEDLPKVDGNVSKLFNRKYADTDLL